MTRTRIEGPSGRPLASSVAEGAGGVLLGDHLWDHGAYRSNEANHVVPTSLTKAWTCPAGYIAVFQGLGILNTTVGTITWHAFAMTDAVTTPTDPADRIAGNTTAAVGESTFTFNLILDEGWSLWTYAASAGLNAFFNVLLIPKPVKGGIWTPMLIKSLATSDTTLYTVTGAGRQAMVVTGHGHNTTGGSLTVTTKAKRAADVSALTGGSRLYGASSTNTYVGGIAQQVGYLLNGDTLTAASSGAGINLTLLICDRPIAGS